MKKLLLAAISVCAAGAVYAQGTLNFGNSTTTRITTSSGANVPAGNPSPFIAGLYWGASGTAVDSLELLTMTQNWGPFAGIFQGGTATFPVAGGTEVTLQVRVWSEGYPTYEAAAAAGLPTVEFGTGPLQTLALGGAGVPPGPPQSLTSPTGGGTPFTGFQLQVVPEPSTIALGLLGLGALALFRRRK